MCEDRSLRRGVRPRVSKACGLGLQRLILRRASLPSRLHLDERRLNLTQSLSERYVLLARLLRLFTRRT